MHMYYIWLSTRECLLDSHTLRLKTRQSRKSERIETRFYKMQNMGPLENVIDPSYVLQTGVHWASHCLYPISQCYHFLEIRSEDI
jgi:hypothetical protein